MYKSLIFSMTHSGVALVFLVGVQVVALTIEQLLELGTEAHRQQYQVIASGAVVVGKARRALSLELRALFEDICNLHGIESKQVGPLVGVFWQAHTAAQVDVKEANLSEGTLAAESDLSTSFAKRFSDVQAQYDWLVAHLPYPLGYKFGDFLREWEQFRRGTGSSNFAFMIAAFNGLVLRILGIVLLAEYASVMHAPDAHLNQQLLGLIKQPSDGSWKQCIELLLRFSEERMEQLSAPASNSIASIIGEVYRPNGSSSADSIAGLTEPCIAFRNRLLHGTHQFTEQEVAQAAERLVRLVKRIAFLGEWSWWLLTEQGCATFRGEQIAVSGMAAPAKVKGLGTLGHPVVYVPGIESALSLYPLLQYAAISGDDIFFYNGWDDAQISFISYRLARAQSLRQLGASPADFFSFLRKIPASGSFEEPRIDFSGVVDFHLACFVGRSRIIDAILDFFQAPTAPYAVIKAPAGMGKTALIARLYRQFEDGLDWPERIWPLWHFCSASGGRHHPVFFLRSILAQLDDWLGLNEKEYPTNIDLLRQAFTQRLHLLQKRQEDPSLPTVQVVLIVDALDEALNSTRGSLSIPALLPAASELPSSMSVLVSYRVDESGLNEQVEYLLPASEQQTYPIPGCQPLGGLTREDVTAMLCFVCGEGRLTSDTEEAIWDTAIAEGRQLESEQTADEMLADPFVLRFIADGLKEGAIDPLRPETVPASLFSLFDRLWNRLPVEHDYFLHRLLGMLALMPSSGSDSLFSEVFSEMYEGENTHKLSPDDIAERRQAINKLLVFTGERYRIFHERFQQYVILRYRPKELAYSFHLPLYQYCISSQGQGSLYDLRHRIFHLQALAGHEGVGESQRNFFKDLLWDALWNESYFNEKFISLHRIDALMDDFLRSFALFRPDVEVSIPPQASMSTEVLQVSVWKQVARSFHLCKRTHAVVSHAVEQSQGKLAEYAKEGDVEQVLRIAHWDGAAYRRLFRVLMGAVWMYESGEDPTRLLSLVGTIGSPQLSATELSFVEALLARSDAPSQMKELIHSWQRNLYD